MKSLNEYITESLSKLDIDKVKDFLIKRYHVSTWEECINKQKFGTCDSIVKSIWNKFYYMFDAPVELKIEYSDIAQKLINDSGEMNGNHYVLKKDNKYYDFARGANCINGIYTLTQKEDNSDKYDIILTKEEENLIVDKYIRVLSYPKEVTKDYYENGILNWKEFNKSSFMRKLNNLKP